MKKIWTILEKIDKYVTKTAYIIIFIFVIYVVYLAVKEVMYKSTPVEDRTLIDSISTVNDSIKIKVNKLDSIKDAKIIEVISLDNDSTVKLFYKLVKE